MDREEVPAKLPRKGYRLTLPKCCEEFLRRKSIGSICRRVAKRFREATLYAYRLKPKGCEAVLQVYRLTLPMGPTESLRSYSVGIPVELADRRAAKSTDLSGVEVE